MMRWLISIFCLTVAGLAQAGNSSNDHIHRHRGEAGHSHQEEHAQDIRLAEARRLQQRHEFGDAVKLLAELIEQKPFNIGAQLLHADVLLHDGRIADSQLACIRVAMSGAQTLAGYCAVQTLTAAKEHERAFEAATALDPADLPDAAQVWALEISADAAWKAGELEAAKNWFEKAMAIEHVPHSTEDAYLAFLGELQN
jgi:Tfp pilus assembly protein PilF